jgi:hypothetical protein
MRRYPLFEDVAERAWRAGIERDGGSRVASCFVGWRQRVDMDGGEALIIGVIGSSALVLGGMAGAWWAAPDG